MTTNENSNLLSHLNKAYNDYKNLDATNENSNLLSHLNKAYNDYKISCIIKQTSEC